MTTRGYGIPAAAALLVGAVLTGGGAAAQSVEIGRTEYLSACAGCHGQDARGDGPMADLLNVSTPDLTIIAQSNNGAFPLGEIVAVIDGRTDLSAHGSTMPVWGARYTAQALLEGETIDDAVLIAQGRMLALASYLYSIQQ